MAILSTIMPREEKILRLYFGIENDGTRAIEELSDELGVTNERICQMEAAALANSVTRRGQKS